MEMNHRTIKLKGFSTTYCQMMSMKLFPKATRALSSKTVVSPLNSPQTNTVCLNTEKSDCCLPGNGKEEVFSQSTMPCDTRCIPDHIYKRKNSKNCDINLDDHISFIKKINRKSVTLFSKARTYSGARTLYTKDLTALKNPNCCTFRRLYTCCKTSDLKFSLAFDKKRKCLKLGSACTCCTLKLNCRCFSVNSMLCSANKKFEYNMRTEPPWRVLFFGTDQISVETLKRLHENMHSSYSVVDSLEVVSNVEKRQVKSYALEHGLKVYDWPFTPMPDKYDIGVLVSFGHLIPDSIIHMFPYGILNMHPSLLPRWRGASPIIHTILNGDSETGISITEIKPKHFDIGPVLMSRRFPVPHRCTSIQLSNILAPIGADMVIESLADLRTLERFEEEQDSSGIRYAHKLVKKNANIDWQNQTCDEIDQQFRAISEIMPLRSKWRGQSAKLLDMIDPDLSRKIDPQYVRGYEGDFTLAVPGTPAYHRRLECVLIKCKDGVVGFNGLVVRKQITAKEFLCGYLTPPDGSIFESLENDLNKYSKKERMVVKNRVKI